MAADSARFAWTGSDVDGNLAGFRYGLDDSTPDEWTTDTTVAFEALYNGVHSFYVQAEDDSGARSLAAVRSFKVEYDSSIVPRGTDTTLEVASWNIQNFPRQGEASVDKVRAVMARLDLDIYAIQEVEDTLAFIRLVNGLSGYSGMYSDDDYGNFYMKTGIVYKTSVVTVHDRRSLFRYNDSVTRPPMELTVTASHNGRTFDFKLIVLHLKAGGSSGDQAERRATCRLLKDHIDDELRGGGELDYIVAGDWNDKLDDPPYYNVFQEFLDDSLDYRFLTWPLRGSSAHGSHIGSGSLIDHIMVTSDALVEYGSGTTVTLRLDDELANYEQLISDHRPVLAWFPVFCP